VKYFLVLILLFILLFIYYRLKKRHIYPVHIKRQVEGRRGVRSRQRYLHVPLGSGSAFPLILNGSEHIEIHRSRFNVELKNRQSADADVNDDAVVYHKLRLKVLKNK